MTKDQIKDEIVAQVREQRRLFERNAELYHALAKKLYASPRQQADMALEMSGALVTIGTVNEKIDELLVSLDGGGDATA